jgi:hypothetical protein
MLGLNIDDFLKFGPMLKLFLLIEKLASIAKNVIRLLFKHFKQKDRDHVLQLGMAPEV